MVAEKLIWDYVGKPIIIFCYNKAKGKAGIRIKKYREKTNKRKFIEEIDLDLLKTYQDEALYLSLSKLLAKKDVLEKIYNRSYKINIWDFKPDDEFIDELLKNCDFIKVSERKSIRDILTHTLRICCICLNEPINDTERKIINGFSKVLNCVNKGFKEIIKTSKQSNMTVLNLSNEIKKLTDNNISDKECALKLNDKYDVTLTSKSKDVYFKIKATAKISDNLQSYSAFDDFYKHILFTCKDEAVKICSYKIINENGETLDEYCDENYYGPTLRIPDIYIDTYTITNDNISKMILNIVPPKIIFHVNLEDEYGNILMENLELQVSRELLSNGNIRISLTDIRKNAMINITLIFESSPIEENSKYKIVSSSTNLKKSDYTDPKCQLSFFTLLEKMIDKTVLIVDVNTHKQIGMFGEITWDTDLTIEKITFLKEFYQNIIYLQNELKIKINIPEEIAIEDMENIKTLFNLVKIGFNLNNDKGNTITLSGVNLLNNNDECIGKKYAFMFSFERFKIFGQEIKLIENINFFLPNGICKNIDNEKISLECLESSFCFIKSNYKDFNKLADKYRPLKDYKYDS